MEKSTNIAESVFDRIENDILTGVFARGEIISEPRLAAMLGVSRTPVREALSRLRQQGLVEDSAKGARVIGITRQDIADIYDIRIRIEGLAAKLCSMRITQQGIKELSDILALSEFYSKREDADGMKALDSAFHHKIYEHSGSRTLDNLLNDLHTRVQRFRRLSLSQSERAKLAIEEHKAILQAIIDRDADMAEKLTVKHIENAKENIMKSAAVASL